MFLYLQAKIGDVLWPGRKITWWQRDRDECKDKKEWPWGSSQVCLNTVNIASDKKNKSCCKKKVSVVTEPTQPTCNSQHSSETPPKKEKTGQRGWQHNRSCKCQQNKDRLEWTPSRKLATGSTKWQKCLIKARSCKQWFKHWFLANRHQWRSLLILFAMDGLIPDNRVIRWEKPVVIDGSATRIY